MGVGRVRMWAAEDELEGMVEDEGEGEMPPRRCNTPSVLMRCKSHPCRGT